MLSAVSTVIKVTSQGKENGTFSAPVDAWIALRGSMTLKLDWAKAVVFDSILNHVEKDQIEDVPVGL